MTMFDRFTMLIAHPNFFIVVFERLSFCSSSFVPGEGVLAKVKSETKAGAFL